MGILGKGVASTTHTHIYTVPANRRAVVLINATNTENGEVGATLSIRQNVDYEVGGILIDSDGTNYAVKPDLVFSEGNATAAVTSMIIKSFSFTGDETGYNIGDVLTASQSSNYDPSKGDVVVEITVTSIDAGTGTIVSFIVSNEGSYNDVIELSDTITFSGGTGVGATMDIATALYGINTVEVTYPGDDYIVTPTIATVDPLDGETVIGNGILTAQMTSDEIRKYDAIEYETRIPKGSSIERSAIVLGAGDSIYAQCDTDDVLNVMVFGVEEIA